MQLSYVICLGVRLYSQEGPCNIESRRPKVVWINVVIPVTIKVEAIKRARNSIVSEPAPEIIDRRILYRQLTCQIRDDVRNHLTEKPAFKSNCKKHTNIPERQTIVC